jgi:hypothetical protein
VTRSDDDDDGDLPQHEGMPALTVSDNLRSVGVAASPQSLNLQHSFYMNDCG